MPFKQPTPGEAVQGFIVELADNYVRECERPGGYDRRMAAADIAGRLRAIPAVMFDQVIDAAKIFQTDKKPEQRRKPIDRMTNVEYLRDLAERLMRIPASYGTDQADVDRLIMMASHLEDGEPDF